MAFGRNMQMNNRSSSSYFLKTTILVFVALCLVGIWMLSSLNIVPVDLSYLVPKSEFKDKVSMPFGDKLGSENDGLASGDAKNTENTVRYKSESESGKTIEKLVEKSKKGSVAKGNDDLNDTFDDTSRSDDGEDAMTEEKLKEKNEIERLESEKKAEQNEKSDGDGSQNEKSEVFPSGDQSELLKETNSQNGAWSTQSVESKNEEEVQASASSKGQKVSYSWKLCNTTARADYIPCLDNVAAIKKLRSTKHYEHRERHCPDQAPTCLVPLPDGYKQPIEWPRSRDKVWYNNVPHTKLVEYKGHQNWVKVSGEHLIFPGGGTQFKHGALHYIDFVQESLPDIAWGKRSRVILDVGCGVASFGGYLFERDVLTMSFAPKDEHEAQVQFALERGIPAILAVMGTKRLPFPSKVFDVVHCARCRVPWHIEGGKLLLELNRLLRPGGYFVWSATPVYQKLPEDVGIWQAMSELTTSICWEMVAKRKDKVNNVGLAIYRKPSDNSCYDKRTEENPPLCQEFDDPDAAWNVPLQACMHRLPVYSSSRRVQWPDEWPLRLEKTPCWFNSSQIGVYGKPAPQDFTADYEHWKHVVSRSYLNGMGINWSAVRNVMDMRSIYGGFAAALRDMKVWVMNIVSIDAPDTLPIIYQRGLFGMYHDWCESFSTYPRTYDLLHADHLFSKLKKRCQLMPVIVEVDRILRPGGNLIVRDNVGTISEIENLAKSLHWEIRLTYSKDNEGLLYAQKSMWRPTDNCHPSLDPSLPLPLPLPSFSCGGRELPVRKVRSISRVSLELGLPQGASKCFDDDGRLKRTGTLWTASAHIITAVIGSGVLSLAWAIGQLGWVAGPAVMLLFSFVTYYTSALLADCYRSGDPVAGKRNYTYMDAVRANLNGFKVELCGYLQYLNIVGVAIGYTIAASISMVAIKRSNCFHKNGDDSPCQVNSNPYMIMFGVAEIFFSQIPDFDQIWWLSIVAAVMSFTYSSIGLALGIVQVIKNGGVRGSLTGISIGTVSQMDKVWRSFQAFGDIAFAYSYSIILIEIQDTIRAPPPSEAKVMKKATLISVAVTTTFYMLCGCMGYAAFGDLAPGNLLTGFGFYNPYWLLDIANVAIVIHLVGAYQVYCQPLFAFVEKWALRTWPESQFISKDIQVPLPASRSYKFNLFRLTWRTAFVVVTTVVSMLLPFFNDVVGFLGAVGFWPLTVYFPVEMYIVQKKVAKWSTRWMCLQLLSLACLIITIASAAGSIAGVVSDLKVYHPFKAR
ncbi:unnamed protein product [Musa textilis]